MKNGYNGWRVFSECLHGSTHELARQRACQLDSTSTSWFGAFGEERFALVGTLEAAIFWEDQGVQQQKPASCQLGAVRVWTSRPLCRWNSFLRFAWRSTYTTRCKMMLNASAYEVAARYQGCSCVFKVTKYSRPLHCFLPANLQQRFRHFTDDIRHGCRSLLQLGTWSPVDWMNRQGHSNKLPSSKTNHSMDMRRNHFWFSSQNFNVF